MEVEDTAAIHQLGVRIVASMVQNIARPDLVRALIDGISGVRVVELVELTLDTDVVAEIEGSVSAISFEVLWAIVRVSVDEQGAELKIAVTGCGGKRLSMKAGASAADQTDQKEDP